MVSAVWSITNSNGTSDKIKKLTTPVGFEPTTSEYHLTIRSPTRYPLRHGASWLFGTEKKEITKALR